MHLNKDNFQPACSEYLAETSRFAFFSYLGPIYLASAQHDLKNRADGVFFWIYAALAMEKNPQNMLFFSNSTQHSLYSFSALKNKRGFLFSRQNYKYQKSTKQML